VFFCGQPKDVNPKNHQKHGRFLNHPEMIASSLGRYVPKNGFSIQGAATDQNRIDISLKRVTYFSNLSGRVQQI
jgi:hypothetical protein